MSLNSLQDDMSRRAASMASMAQRASNPQDIQAMQQRIVAGVQSGAIKPYVGIPLIQELSKKLSEVKAKMAQGVATAGMPPPPQGGAPIAQQVMQQAAQESQGVPALESNLPQSYAGGGIIAFEGGGQVERYQNAGFTGTTAQVGQLGYDQLMKLYQTSPELAREAALRAGPTGQKFLSALNTAVRGAGPAAAIFNVGLPASVFASGVTGGMSPEQRAGMYSNPMLGAMGDFTSEGAAIQNAPSMDKPTMSSGEQIMNALSFFPKTLISAPGDKANPKGYGFSRLFAPDTPTTAAPAAATPASTGPINPYGQSKANFAGVNSLLGGTGGGAGGAGAGGGSPYGKFEMPKAPTLKDYDTITKDLPKNMQVASEKAVKATQEKLEEFDKPLDAKGARLEGREAQLAKDTEISRWMALLKGGARTLAGTSRFAGENFGKGFETGIDELVRGEAANRAAKDKLDSAKDNLDDQRIAAKKGNYQAAQAAGNRAADDERQATQMTMTGAHYGNTEALNRYQAQQQGALGIESLNLKSKELAQTGAFQAKQLAAMEQRYAAMDKQAQARMQQVRAGAMGKFMETMAPQLNAQFTKEYGPNWRTSTDPRSLEAQMKFKQQQNAYIMDVLGQYDNSASARDSSEL